MLRTLFDKLNNVKREMKQLRYFLLLSLIFSRIKLEDASTRVTRDLTLKPGATGEGVVDAVLEKMQQYLAINNDYSLMKRIALVETSFGEDLPEDAWGTTGIWKISSNIHSSLLSNINSSKIMSLLNQIEKIFKISPFLEERNYSIPLHSALEARLFIELTTGNKIPSTLSSQSLWWENHYNTEKNKSVFTEKVSEYQRDTNLKSQDDKMDLWFLIDGSQNIRQSDFKLLQSFVLAMAGNYEVSHSDVQVGFSVYSYRHEVYYRFRNSDSFSSFQVFVSSSKRISERRNVANALIQVMNRGFDERMGARALNGNIERMVIFITNGKSSEDFAGILAKVHETLQVIAIGIGTTVAAEEIKLIANKPYQENSFLHEDFEDLLTNKSVDALYGRVVGMTEDISKKKLDLWFLMDAANVTHEEFQLLLNFSATLAKKFPISRSYVQVGLSVFGENYKTFYSFADEQNVTHFMNSIVSARKYAAPKKTGTALKDILTHGFSTSFGARRSRDVKRLVVMVTTGRDGEYNSIIKSIHDDGITVFVVGIGKNVNKSSSDALASFPPSKYSYEISTFDELAKPDELIDLLYHGIHKTSFPFVDAITKADDAIDSTITLTAGGKRYLKVILRKNHTITVKMSESSGTGVVYVSTKIPNPSEAFHDFKFKFPRPGTSDLFLSEKDFSEFDGDSQPVYFTIASDGQSAFDVNFKAILVELNAKPEGESTELPFNIVGWSITLIVVGCIVFSVIILVLYDQKTSLQSSDAEECGRSREPASVEAVDKILKELQVLSERTEEQFATSTIYDKLCKKLNEAEEIHVSRAELEEYYHIVQEIKQQHNDILEKLFSLTSKAKKAKPELETLEDLQSQIYLAESKLLSLNRLVKANAALEELKHRLNLTSNTKEERKAWVALREVTLEANEPTATSSCLLRLSEKISQAERLQMKPDMIRESYLALDTLNHRLYSILDNLKDLKIKAQQVTVTTSCMLKFEKQIKLAETTKVSQEEIDSSRDELKNLKGRLNILEDLRSSTKDAENMDFSTNAVDTLQKRLDEARQFGAEASKLKESADILELAKKRIKTKEDLAILVQESNDPEASAVCLKVLQGKMNLATNLGFTTAQLDDAYDVESLLKKRLAIRKNLIHATAEANKPTATVECLERLEECIVDSKAYQTPSEFVSDAYDAMELLSKRLNVLKLVQKGLTEANIPIVTTDFLYKLRDAKEQAEVIGIPSQQLDELDEAITLLQHRLRFLRILKDYTDDAWNATDREEHLDKLTKHLKLAAGYQIPPEMTTDAVEAIKELRFRIEGLEQLYLIGKEVVNSNARQEYVEQLDKQLHILSSHGIPRKEMQEFYNLLASIDPTRVFPRSRHSNSNKSRTDIIDDKAAVSQPVETNSQGAAKTTETDGIDEALANNEPRLEASVGISADEMKLESFPPDNEAVVDGSTTKTAAEVSGKIGIDTDESKRSKEEIPEHEQESLQMNNEDSPAEDVTNLTNHEEITEEQ